MPRIPPAGCEQDKKFARFGRFVDGLAGFRYDEKCKGA